MNIINISLTNKLTRTSIKRYMTNTNTKKRKVKCIINNTAKWIKNTNKTTYLFHVMHVSTVTRDERDSQHTCMYTQRDGDAERDVQRQTYEPKHWNHAVKDIRGNCIYGHKNTYTEKIKEISQHDGRCNNTTCNTTGKLSTEVRSSRRKKQWKSNTEGVTWNITQWDTYSN